MTVSLFGRKEYFITQKSVCLGVCAKVCRFLKYQLDIIEPGQTVHMIHVESVV